LFASASATFHQHQCETHGCFDLEEEVSSVHI
jgi:hypothetical protein